MCPHCFIVRVFFAHGCVLYFVKLGIILRSFWISFTIIGPCVSCKLCIMLSFHSQLLVLEVCVALTKLCLRTASKISSLLCMFTSVHFVFVLQLYFHSIATLHPIKLSFVICFVWATFIVMCQIGPKKIWSRRTQLYGTTTGLTKTRMTTSASICERSWKRQSPKPSPKADMEYRYVTREIFVGGTVGICYRYIS